MQKSLITLALASKMPTWASHSHLSTLMEQASQRSWSIQLRTLGQFQFSCEHPLPISWQIKILDSSYTNNFPKWKTRKPLVGKKLENKKCFIRFIWNNILLKIGKLCFEWKIWSVCFSNGIRRSIFHKKILISSRKYIRNPKS